MNYLKIQFRNGLIYEYKTPFNNPNLDILADLRSSLFVDFKHLDEKIAKGANLDVFYNEYNKLNTLKFMCAKVLEFKKIDGRTKQAKTLKYYTHRFLFENYK